MFELVPPFEVLVHQEREREDDGHAQQHRGRSPSVPSRMAVIDIATVRLLVRRMIVLTVPTNVSSSIAASWNSLGMAEPVDGIHEEHPAEEDQLGEEEEPHPHAGPDIVAVVRVPVATAAAVRRCSRALRYGFLMRVNSRTARA